MITPVKAKIQELKEYFKNQKNISMAFIFGSFAKGQHLPDSDMDIAVYFNPAGRALDPPTHRSHPSHTHRKPSYSPKSWQHLAEY